MFLQGPSAKEADRQSQDGLALPLLQASSAVKMSCRGCGWRIFGMSRALSRSDVCDRDVISSYRCHRTCELPSQPRTLPQVQSCNLAFRLLSIPYRPVQVAIQVATSSARTTETASRQRTSQSEVVRTCCSRSVCAYTHSSRRLQCRSTIFTSASIRCPLELFVPDALMARWLLIRRPKDSQSACEGTHSSDLAFV